MYSDVVSDRNHSGGRTIDLIGSREPNTSGASFSKKAPFPGLFYLVESTQGR